MSNRGFGGNVADVGIIFRIQVGRGAVETYSDMSSGEFIQQENQPIVQRFDEVLGKEAPTFCSTGTDRQFGVLLFAFGDDARQESEAGA